MMTFLLSQLLGLVVFCTVNFGIYCYISYKRNQAFKVAVQRKPVRYHFATALLILFFSLGFGYRVWNIRDGVEQIYLSREINLREEQMPNLQ